MKKRVKQFTVLLLVILVAALFSGCKIGKVANQKYNENNPGEIYYEGTSEENIVENELGIKYANNEILLVAKENVKKSEIEKLAIEYDAKVIGYIEVTGDYQLRLNKTYSYEELEELVQKLEEEDIVEDASIQNMIQMESQGIRIPDDSRWSNEWDELNPSGENWGIEAIRAPYTWNYIEDMTPIRIGLIDSMFNTEHSDLDFAETFYNPDQNSLDNSHGTHVAGIMGASYNNSDGITGVYPWAAGNLYGVSSRGTSNQNGIFFWKIAFAQLIVRNVKVINISMGYNDVIPFSCVQNDETTSFYQEIVRNESEVLGTYLEKFLNKGYDFVMTVSAGNDRQHRFIKENNAWTCVYCSELEFDVKDTVLAGDGLANWNSRFCAIENEAVKDRIIVVGAAKLNSQDPYNRYSITDFSNTGSRVDVMAPGQDIWSTGLQSELYCKKDGTSMAAPHVAGAAATVWAFDTGLTGDRVKEIIVDSSKGEFQNVTGTDVGMVNVLAAMADAADERTEGNPFANQEGIILGKVLDANGTEITDAHIKIHDSSNGSIVEETDTDNIGSFEVALSQGKYKLTISKQGYQETDTPEIILENGLVEELGNIVLNGAITDFMTPEDMIMTIGEVNVIEPEFASNYPLDISQDIGFLSWTSSDESVATVTTTGKSGILRARTKGETVITATLESGGKTITKSTNLRVASKGRDTVLVLDVSGSMRGTPMAEMKQAAIDFCNQLLLDEYNNRVGIVFYDDEVDKIDLTNDLNTLVSYIDSVDDGGMTNMEAGIATAKEMLDTYGKTDSIKNIVIMADGLPNEGKTSDSGSLQSSQYAGYTDALYANAVIDTAQEAMKSYNMYSLGFFHGLYDDELDFATKLMTKLTNQTDGYHQVVEAENLQFAFGDISEEISDGSKIIINIACPVDVQITYNGETLSSAQSNYNAQTSFGSLQLLGKDQDIKVVSLEPDIDYDVELVGTGEGEMNYSVNYLDESEEVIDHRDFPSVPITSTTKITSSTDVTVEDMSLNVDKNGDGEVDIIWTATAKGVAEITYDSTPEPEEKDVETEPIEEVVENNNDEELWPILLVVFGIIIVCGAILITFIVIGNDSSKKKFEIEENEQNHEQDKSQSTEPNIDVVQAYVAKLEVLSVHEEPREIEMEDGKTYGIGKEKQYVDILVTSSEQVSRLHCSISYSSKYKKYFVIDCSANGTFYQNRQRLEKGKRVAVEPGTTLMLADENCKIKLK